MRSTFFPKEFIEKYSKFLGSEWDEFFKVIQTKQPKSFWVNTNRATVAEVTASLKKNNIPFVPLKFHENAFGVNVMAPGQLEEYQNGFISIQERAAMMPVAVLAPTKEDYVLDACSAPGMKTIQLSNLAGKVFAAELHTKRFEILKKTIAKFDLKNVEAKRIDFRNLKRNKRFDKILLDVVCSSEGLVRKKREALADWSQNLVKRKAHDQKHMIVRAFDYLKDGGIMVYSTCSFAPEENEEVVNYLLGQRKNAVVEPVKLEGVKIRENKLCKNAVRLYPQDNDTQQFFFAKIRKEKSN
jgi:NOL1/NOP2/sun family putative RNA methylase